MDIQNMKPGVERRCTPIVGAKYLLVLKLIFPLYSIQAQSAVENSEIVIDSDTSSVSGVASAGSTIFTYSGSVRIVSVNLEILGDEAEVTMGSATEEIVSAITRGSPATFTHKSDTGEGIVSGQSERIEYLVDEGVIGLHGSALLNYDGATIQCENITYNLEADLYQGDGGCRAVIL